MYNSKEIATEEQIMADADLIQILPVTSCYGHFEGAKTSGNSHLASQLTGREIENIETTVFKEPADILKRKRLLDAARSKAYRDRKKAKSEAVDDINSQRQRIAENIKRSEQIMAEADLIQILPSSSCHGVLKAGKTPKNVTFPPLSPGLSQNHSNLPMIYQHFSDHSVAHKKFKEQFADNNFGIACSVCERLWYERNLKRVPNDSWTILKTEFHDIDLETMRVCATCYSALKKGRIPIYSTKNGFKYPPRPDHLPELNLVTERLISPRLPFMQIRRLRHGQGQYGILGQIINVPVSVNNMVRCLPREIDNDFCINVHIKRKKLHKSSYIEGYVQKRVLRLWLEFLINTPMYKFYGIKIDNSLLTERYEPTQPTEDLSEEISIEESLHAQQQTLFWNADNFLRIAPAETELPKSVLFDEHCEELAFPSIYLGQFRVFKEGLCVTPYMMASSELRRADRRGVTPQHLLYMAMKILRLRTRDALTTAFKYIGKNTKLTRAQVESSDFLNVCLESNLAFLRSIPNSVYYWSQRKRDLFAMIRQLGKPTFFLTMSANEIGWPKLLKLLYRLRHNGSEIGSEELANMHYNLKATLINEDAVTCAIHFNKLVHVILSILQSSRSSPFGKHYVKHYFKRIEFQHRGSPHAHILLWLNDSPHDALTDGKLAAEAMIDQLVSVSKENASGFDKLQRHKHTFTCFKNKNATICRFQAPFMPCKSTTILEPLSKTDRRRQNYLKIYKRVWKSLETNDYVNLDHFLRDNKIKSYAMYLDILRAGITRPRVFLKRETTEKWINPYNPFILNVLGSNMDFQFIIEEYSCAAYVVEYVNKSNRGISNLQRKIIDTMEEHPEFDLIEIARKLSVDMLNCVELSSQEAAWFLLRQAMSESSVKIVYIPTMWPMERDRVRKSNKALEEENVEPDSCDIWLENCFDKYQKRPQELNDITLAQAVAYYNLSKANKWKRRISPRVIRYRNYDMAADPNEYKREMVTLHLSFRDEELDILDEKKYIKIFDDNEVLIMERRREFESNLDIEKTMQICRELCIENNEDEELASDLNFLAARERDLDPYADFIANPNADVNSDLRLATLNRLGPIVKKRDNIMNKEDFNLLMRSANYLQKGLLLHVIWHLLNDESKEPLQVFLTGPAGCGKTFVINALREIYNRFCNTDGYCNAYLTCASTGKAAVAIDGTTVHTAFKITIGQAKPLSFEVAQQFRSLFKYIECILIDEVSMISAELNEKIDSRLRQISYIDSPYGAKDIFLIGDLRQLPAVRATPIYKQTKHSMVGPTLWRGLRFYELNEVMRQANADFSQLLTKIGNGQMLNEKELNLIESRFCSRHEADVQCPNGVRLFFRNYEVDQHNKQILNASPDKVLSIAKDVLSGCSSNEQLVHVRQQLHKKAVLDTGGLPYEIVLVIGRPYMITTNIDVSDGLANGAIGYLEHIEYHQDIQTNDNIEKNSTDGVSVNRLWLRFPVGCKIGLKLRNLSAGYVQRHEIIKDLVPIARRNATIYLNTNRTINAKRNHFPIIPACGMTIHKSQGGTFEHVVYEYEKCHDQQLVYVALSRVTSLEGLFIVSKNSDKTFHHGRRTSHALLPLQTEFARLANNSLHTRQEAVLEFIRFKDSTSLLIFNCQSLRAHNKDLTDAVTQECDFLMLSETWLCNNQSISIPNFNCCTQFKREDQRAGGVAIYKKKNTLQKITPIIEVREKQSLNNSELIKSIGDVCAVECIISNGLKVLLIVVYISPNQRVSDIVKFLNFVIFQYTLDGSNVHAEKLPMILGGDFNVNFSTDDGGSLIRFLEEKFNLQINSSRNFPTTNAKSTIDAVFSRYINSIKTTVYISYFSFHRPIVVRFNE